MSEKFFVVSESELADMYFAGETQSDDLTDDAWAACHARPADKLRAVVLAAKDFLASDGDYFSWTEDERHCLSRLKDTLLALEAWDAATKGE